MNTPLSPLHDQPTRTAAGGTVLAQHATTGPPSAQPDRHRAATWGLVLGLVALAGGVLSAAAVGGSIGPMEHATPGGYFTQTPGWYQILVLVLVGSTVLWTAAGIAGLVTGILGTARSARPGRGIAAIVLAVLGPFLSFGAFIAAALLGVAAIG